MSFGIGGYLVNKFVKQTKINSWLAHKCGFDHVAPVEAKPGEGAGCARILWKADAAVRQEQPGLAPGLWHPAVSWLLGVERLLR